MTNMNNRLRHERVTTERASSRATERARAATKAKAKKQRIVITSVACTLVVAIAATFAVMGFSNNSVKTADTAPTSVTKMINTDLAAAKADKTDTKKDNTANTTAGQSTQSVQTAQPAVQQTAVQPAVVQDNRTTENSNYQPASQSATEASQDRIDNINGERVYIDTKRTAPDVTGNPDHYYAYGKTSYGFDWTYSADNGNFVLRCNYNFDRQQYDFQFYGTAPGTANVTLYYNTDDNTQVPVQLTVNIDSDLNASIG